MIVFVGVVLLVQYGFSNYWGGVLVVVGGLNLVIRHRRMFIINGLTLAFMGLVTIFRIEFGFWTLLGLFLIGLGIWEMRKFSQYA